MKQKLLLTITLWLALLGSTWAQGNALHFDGTNDYVACPAINPNTFTLAAWVCPTVTNKSQVILSTLNETTKQGMELWISVGNIPIVTLGNGSLLKNVIATTDVNANQWVCFVVTYDGSTVKLFINGKEAASISFSSYSAGTEALCLGRRSVYSSSAQYFQGKIDEVGIWDTNISAAKIKTSLLNGLSGNDPGLLACYKFDQGLPEGNNPGATFLSDVSGKGKNGTLSSFELSGTSSNWVGGYHFPYGSNALYFDGKDDYVNCSAINLKNFTYEAWVCPTALGKDQVILSTLNETAKTGVELRINASNKIEAIIGIGTELNSISSFIVSKDTWVHIALVNSNNRLSIYVDGSLYETTNSMGFTAGSQTLSIGRRSSNAGQYFSGKIDEVRIWNIGLDNFTLKKNMNNTIDGTNIKLKAYYTFDQGIADGNNSGVVTLIDVSNAGNNGVLSYFGYTGTTSNWVEGRMIVNPSKPTLTFASAKSVDLSFETKVLTNDIEYVDWGNGILYKFAGTSTGTTISTSSYITGNTVNVYNENINYLNVSDKAITALDVSKNPALQYLICNNNQLSIATLPQPKSSYTTYIYAPQQPLAATFTNGVVDLSSQLTAVDVDGNTQTTSYKWYLADGTPLTANVDFVVDHGVFTFVKLPATAVYCEMVNSAFPGLTLRTEAITVKISTGVSDQEAVIVNLYPNPCRDYVEIGGGTGKIRRVSFVNLAGQTMLVEDAPAGRIHVASLKPGIYLVKVEDDNGNTAVLRLVKQ